MRACSTGGHTERLQLVRIGPDYHVEIRGFSYSVPANLIRQQLDARTTAGSVELFEGVQRNRRPAVGGAPIVH